MKKAFIAVCVGLGLFFSKQQVKAEVPFQMDPATAAYVTGVAEQAAAAFLNGLIKAGQNLSPEQLSVLTKSLAKGAMEGLQGGMANFTEGGLSSFFSGSGATFNQELYTGFHGADTAILSLLNGSFNVTYDGIWHIGVPTLTVAFGYYFISYGLQYGGDIFSKWVWMRLSKPKLALEENNGGFVKWFKSFFYQEKILSVDDLILPDQTKERVRRFERHLEVAQTKGKPLPTVLFFGPPGTGKTAIGKRIAKKGKYTYVFLSGSSFAKYDEKDAIAEVEHLLFWAKRKKKVVIFIDEIDTLVGDRSTADEKTKKVMNHLFAQTGERVPEYTIIGTTNRVKTLDPAIFRRFTHTIEIPLPGSKERNALFRYYFQESILEDDSIELEDHLVNRKLYRQMAAASDGLSGADIQDISNTLALSAEVDGILTRERIFETIREFQQKYQYEDSGEEEGIELDTAA